MWHLLGQVWWIGLYNSPPGHHVGALVDYCLAAGCLGWWLKFYRIRYGAGPEACDNALFRCWISISLGFPSGGPLQSTESLAPGSVSLSASFISMTAGAISYKQANQLAETGITGILKLESHFLGTRLSWREYSSSREQVTRIWVGLNTTQSKVSGDLPEGCGGYGYCSKSLPNRG